MIKWSFALLLLVKLAACTADAPPAPLTSPAVAATDQPVILVIGDSLSAGYGIELSESWVSLLRGRLADRGYNYRVINASVSGDTTSAGLARLKSALPRYRPTLVVIELGGNDGLRAIGLPVIESNFNAMIELCRDAGADVVLLGMRIPSNYGPRYAQGFHNIYQQVSDRYKIPLVEFFLDGVAIDARMMQADGIHPNAAAQPRLLDNAWPLIDQALSNQ